MFKVYISITFYFKWARLHKTICIFDLVNCFDIAIGACLAQVKMVT